MSWLKGKKSYIMLIVSGILGLLQSFGVAIPEWLWVIDTVLTGGAFRAGMNNSK